MYLTEGTILTLADGKKRAVGKVYGNPRITDGHNIRTSAIKREFIEDGKRFIETQNNIYELREEA